MNKTDLLENILPFVTKQSRYLGNEINAVKKDISGVALKFVLAFPDAYEVGMSHLGLHILYNVLNSRENIACERAFAPWPDMESAMLEKSMGLSTLESRMPIRDCDILGFSLEYELSYPNVLKMLSLADIPLLSKLRDESFPLVIAGGPSTYNPEPVADFFDAFVIGEAEESILDLCETFIAWKKSNSSKKELLEALSEIEGIYIPSFFNAVYREDGTFKEIIPLKKGYEIVNKRIISGFNDVPFCTSPIVPYMQIIHDRAGIEIARGCSRGCRFCMAGMIYRPVREKSISKIRELVGSTLLNTGYEEVSLVSLSSGDFSGINEIMRILISENRKNKVAISFPSLRVETITRNLMEEIKKIRKTGFTIAPEAGTQRLRDFINKGITEEEIMGAASKIYSSGWNLIKLYFMIGLPTETSEDLNGIIDLSKKISAIDHRKQLNVSVSTFVPKPHTPFQWERQESSETIVAKQKLLKDNLRKRQIHFKWHNSSLSILEGVFSRGDRKLCNVLIKAHQMGAGFEAWTEHFKPELWDRAFSECGIDKNIYLNRREIGECLPWAHISCGISSDFLIKELEKAQTGQLTHDCRTHGCAGCGICEKIDISVKNLEADCNVQSFTHNVTDTMSSDVENSPVQPDSNNSSYRYCIHFTKTGPARFLSHLELSRCFARAMRRSQLPLKYSNGFHPLPRIIFSEALPVGMESGSEMLYVDLMEKLDENEMIHKINSHLPEGIEALTSEEIPLEKSLSADTIKKYLISFPENTALDFPSNSEIKHLIEIFKNKKECVIQSVKNNAAFQTDLKEIVRRIDLGENSALEIELDLTNRKIPRLTEITGYILNLGDNERKAIKILKL